MDKRGANKAAIEQAIKDHEVNIEVCQSKYPNNLIEQDHHFITKRSGPMLGFKNFFSAMVTLTGIELMHVIQKGQMKSLKNRALGSNTSAADQFYSLAH